MLSKLKGKVLAAMADENNEDDSWLYGSSNENQDIQSEPNDSMQINDVSIEKDANHENVRNFKNSFSRRQPSIHLFPLKIL